jgi:hypothetical protein
VVADVVRHLKALDLGNISSDFGILTNSATSKSNLDKELGAPTYRVRECKCFDKRLGRYDLEDR